MKKRQLVRQRRMVRKVLIGLALLVTLYIETLMVGAFSRDLLTSTATQQFRSPPGIFFPGL